MAGEVHIGGTRFDDGGDFVGVALAEPRAASGAAFAQAAAVAVTAGLEKEHLGFAVRPDPPEGTLVNSLMGMTRPDAVRPVEQGVRVGDPRPARAKRLETTQPKLEVRRLRLDDWRVLYAVNEELKQVQVFAI